MKKILSTCIVASLFLFLVSCGGSNNTNDYNNEVIDEIGETENTNTSNSNTEEPPNEQLANALLEEWHYYDENSGSESFYFSIDNTFETSVYVEEQTNTRKGTYRIVGNNIYFKYNDMNEELITKATIADEVLQLVYNEGQSNEITKEYEILRGC